MSDIAKDPALAPKAADPAVAKPDVPPAPADAAAQAGKVVLASDTQQGYLNAAKASKGQDSVTVDVFLQQKGHMPHQLGDFVAKMNEKFTGGSKAVPEWVEELESFLGRKIA